MLKYTYKLCDEFRTKSTSKHSLIYHLPFSLSIKATNTCQTILKNTDNGVLTSLEKINEKCKQMMRKKGRGGKDGERSLRKIGIGIGRDDYVGRNGRYGYGESMQMRQRIRSAKQAYLFSSNYNSAQRALQQCNSPSSSTTTRPINIHSTHHHHPTRESPLNHLQPSIQSDRNRNESYAFFNKKQIKHINNLEDIVERIHSVLKNRGGGGSK